MSDMVIAPAVGPFFVNPLLFRLLQHVLKTLRHGRLVCRLPGGAHLEQCGTMPGPNAELEVHRPGKVLGLLLQGAAGLHEGYIAGVWSSPDLPALLTLLTLNFTTTPPSAPFAAPRRAMDRLRHAANVNTRRGARRNILAHYDLGNSFYAAWLDASMLYSAAFYQSQEDTLETAQTRKLDLITEWLDVPKGAHVLEIGCGWGALARRLGVEGARVTGLTLSPAQLDHARRFENENVSFALRDYRDETGQYDRIVSVEMLEAVGEAYWPTYFRTLRACLKPGGRAVLQIITIAAERYDDYRRTPDFIQRHIFPGGMLPPKATILAHARRAALEPGRIIHFGDSYARTLADWRKRFLAAGPRLAAMGFDERFQRMWEYYLAYCEAGFSAGFIDVGLYELKG